MARSLCMRVSRDYQTVKCFIRKNESQKRSPFSIGVRAKLEYFCCLSLLTARFHPKRFSKLILTIKFVYEQNRSFKSFKIQSWILKKIKRQQRYKSKWITNCWFNDYFSFNKTDIGSYLYFLIKCEEVTIWIGTKVLLGRTSKLLV
jgi:hypothetical protein